MSCPWFLLDEITCLFPSANPPFMLTAYERLFGNFPLRAKLVFLKPDYIIFPQNSSLFLGNLLCQNSKILRLASKYQIPNSLLEKISLERAAS